VIDAESLLETAELTCSRCGRRDPDTFTDLAGLEAFLASPGVIPPVAGPVPRGPLIRQVDLAGLAAFGPVHRHCQPGPPCPDCRGSGQVDGGRCARCKGRGRWNVLRSVA
jgi:hypothetical protein